MEKGHDPFELAVSAMFSITLKQLDLLFIHLQIELKMHHYTDILFINTVGTSSRSSWTLSPSFNCLRVSLRPDGTIRILGFLIPLSSI